MFINKKAFSTINLPSSTSILDIGCGTGQTAAFLNHKYGCLVTGIDKHPIMIEKAKNRLNKTPSVKIVKGDAECLSFKDNAFDFILAESVISFTNVSKTLQELSRVLKQGGQMIAIEMSSTHSLSDKFQKKIENLYGIHKVLSQKEWEEKLIHAGFHSISIKNVSPELKETFITDMQPSENLNIKWYDMWDTHNSLVNQSETFLRYQVLKCEK
ncbi:class I SAM-dependent methyltransferase [Salibacterium salarium]|uniref:class I SAM-dependent methyltransferase n=1 Tax=Salibacterium salarium TaxID=284579 RepID=UPI0032B1A47D